MIKKIKLALLLVMIIFLAACSVEYELLITEDHRFIETAKVEIPRDKLPTREAVARQKIAEIISDYRQQEPSYNQHQIDYRFGSDYVFLTIEREYNNFQQLQSSKLFQHVYQRVNLEEGEYYNLTFSDLIIGDSPQGLKPAEWEDNITLIIRSYNTVSETNAHEENFFNNTFVWDFSSEDKEEEIKIVMEYSPRYDIILMDFFREYYLAIILLGVLLAGSGFAYFYYVAANRVRNRV